MQTTPDKQPNRTIPLALGGLALLALIPALWFGCSPDDAALDDSRPDGEETRAVSIVDAQNTCVTLFAGQTIAAGTVCVGVDNTVDTSTQCSAQGTKGALTVTYNTTGGWQLTEAHLAAGDAFSDIPTNNKGNPQPGQFPYHSGDITGATTYAFQVPLCVFGLDAAAEACDPVTAYFAAHAVVRKDNGDGTWDTQTGWGDGPRIVEKGNWATFFTLELQCEEDKPPVVETCETSFAKADSGTCFIGADFNGDGTDDGFSRWGWSNGPITPGSSATWPVYAAAGQCDISKGTHIGNIAVAYGTDGTMQLSFDRLAGFYLDEQHLYVGNEPLPRDNNGEYTVAPGQYPIVEELDNATHTERTVAGLSGDVYVVYHAVACGEYE
jgi:hypothetical protein